MGLIAELRRRNVIRVGLLYCIAAWLVLQVADVLFGLLGVPEWSLRLVFGLLLLGLPLALIFAWVFELTPEGLRRERPSAEAGADAARALPEVPRRLDGAIVVLLVLALGFLAADRWLFPRQQEPTAASAGEAAPGIATPSGDVTPASADPRSVAVLPFVNMSGDPENEYFSDGLTEELLNVLAQVDGLRVAARTSSFRFKGHAGDMAEIARQLKVGHLLEGSVRRAGDRVRITAQLINPADGFHLWSQTYDRQLTDIFAIQDDIAAEVARALRAQLLGETMPAVARPSTGDLEAYTAYLRGKQELRGTGYAAYERADAAFRSALALDPDFAAAHAALAETWRRRANWGIVTWPEAREHIRDGVARALALDPEQPLAWTLDGLLVFYDEDKASLTAMMDTAEPSFRRALELEPGQLEASEALAMLLRMRGNNEEALAILLAALERDPLSSRAHLQVGQHYRLMGQLEAAAASFQAAMELDPDNPRPPSALAQLRAEQGRIGEAIALQAEKLPLDPLDHEGPLQVARLYLELGMTEAALPWLEAAERMAPEATTTKMFRAMWHWRRDDLAQAAGLAATALEAELPERWGSEQVFETMFLMHEFASGRHERVLAHVLEKFPAALDPAQPGEPIDTEASFMKAATLPLLRLRDGEAVARERAEQLLAQLESAEQSLPPNADSLRRAMIYAELDRPAAMIAALRRADKGRYVIDNWYWTEVDLFPLRSREAPAVQAYLTEIEAVRERERAWLAEAGRMPEPEVVLAEMAAAARAMGEAGGATGTGGAAPASPR
jgi:TolB-like protein/Tfp pilus assembly protein PilF